MGAWFNRLPPFVRAILSGCAGFVAYGAWAYWINERVDGDMGERAALLQGTYSFVLTVSMTALMDGLLHLMRDMRYRIGLTVFFSSLFSVGVAAAIHWWAGTPEILLTIMPGAAIGLGYAMSYVAAVQGASDQAG